MVSNHNSVSVVVVDDDRHICEMTARFLARSGYEALPLFDGRPALKYVVEREPDVLLIDHIMPGLNGTAVIEELTERQSPTVSILFTGFGDKEIVRNAFRVGALDVLFKPVLPEFLILSVDKAAAQARRNFHIGNFAVVPAGAAAGRIAIRTYDGAYVTFVIGRSVVYHVCSRIHPSVR